jgi:ribosomal protein S18 acetylase RimI-like enzyme
VTSPAARIAVAADLPAIESLHCAVFREGLTARLGRPYARRLVGWYLDYGVCVVHDDGGVLGGYVFGGPLETARQMNRALAPLVVAGVARRPSMVLRPLFISEGLRRVAMVASRRRKVDDGPLEAPGFTLTGIGVRDDHRGRGIAGLMMQRFEAEAARRGFRSLRLSVYKRNAAARRLYEKRGWTPFAHPTYEEVTYYGLPLGRGYSGLHEG